MIQDQAIHHNFIMDNDERHFLLDMKANLEKYLRLIDEQLNQGEL